MVVDAGVEPLPPDFVPVVGLPFDHFQPKTARPAEKTAKLRAMLDHYPVGIHKVDRKNRPIYIERNGRANAKGMFRAGTAEDIVDLHLHMMELITYSHEAASKMCGEPIKQHTVIFDMDGLGVHQFYVPGLKVFKECAMIDQEYYPEFMAQLFIVNAPRVFSMFWRFVKPILNPRTLEKIHILSGDARQYEELLQHVDPHNLPHFLGGLCRCAGGCVPAAGCDEDSGQEQATVLKLKAGSLHQERVEVTTPGHGVSYEFWIKGKDLGFGLVFEAQDGSTPEVLVPNERVKPQEEHFHGHFPARVAGTFVFSWDNSYSWARSKEVHFRLNVDEAAEDTAGHD
mmetsp:Transcript_2734/g.7108  ORF Transcript_2734/g.7108 Transcript_2734/m.7108 type:complete len:341 (+) Transcript_2734:1-1023(+)